MVSAFSGLGGILLALAYGVFVDTEDMIIPSILSVTAEEWLILIILGAMGLVGFFALTRYALFENASPMISLYYQVSTVDTPNHSSSSEGYGN